MDAGGFLKRVIPNFPAHSFHQEVTSIRFPKNFPAFSFQEISIRWFPRNFQNKGFPVLRSNFALVLLVIFGLVFLAIFAPSHSNIRGVRWYPHLLHYSYHFFCEKINYISFVKCSTAFFQNKAILIKLFH